MPEDIKNVEPFDVEKSTHNLRMGFLPQLQWVMNQLKEVSGLSDTELAPAFEVAVALSKPYPAGRTACQERIAQLGLLRSRLDTLILQLKEIRSKFKREYEKRFDSEYSRLVKLGKPSQQAIVSEIRSKNQEVVDLSDKIERLGHFIEYLSDLRWTLGVVREDLHERARDVLRTE